MQLYLGTYILRTLDQAQRERLGVGSAINDSVGLIASLTSVKGLRRLGRSMGMGAPRAANGATITVKSSSSGGGGGGGVGSGLRRTLSLRDLKTPVGGSSLSGSGSNSRRGLGLGISMRGLSQRFHITGESTDENENDPGSPRAMKHK
jgi:hypothetical protein